jgi:hypothetical protein
MRQEAPDPEPLAQLVAELRYKDGFSFSLTDMNRGQGSEGLTLIVNRTGPDAYHPERNVSVNHFFIVPAAAYDRAAWQRWLLDQVLLVEQHEACEFFRLDQPGKGDDGITLEFRPYAPNHGPGRDPYEIVTLGTREDAETSFRGVRRKT